MNIRTLLVVSLAFALLVQCAEAGQSTNEAVSLADLPSFYSSEYKVDPYIEAAIKLQALGKEAAIERLKKLSRSALVEAEERMESGGGEKAEKEYEEISRTSNSDVLDERGKIAVLCRMLFIPRQRANFERAGLGGLTVLGDTHHSGISSEDAVLKKWQLEPIELVDDIPFVVVDGSIYQGWIDPGGVERYVRYCATNCDWSKTRFTLKTKEEKEAALRKLISSPKWEQPLNESEKSFLKSQLW